MWVLRSYKDDTKRITRIKIDNMEYSIDDIVNGKYLFEHDYKGNPNIDFGLKVKEIPLVDKLMLKDSISYKKLIEESRITVLQACKFHYRKPTLEYVQI